MFNLIHNESVIQVDCIVRKQSQYRLTEFQRRQRIKILLAGMYAPPNLGRDYGQAFNAVYPRLAKVHSIPLYPFFLDGVAGVPELNQADGIHPNAKGVDVIVERILPYVLKLLGRS